MERFAHTCVSGPFRGCRGRCAPEALHIVCSCDRRDDRKIFISSTMRAEGLDTPAQEQSFSNRYRNCSCLHGLRQIEPLSLAPPAAGSNALPPTVPQARERVHGRPLACAGPNKFAAGHQGAAHACPATTAVRRSERSAIVTGRRPRWISVLGTLRRLASPGSAIRTRSSDSAAVASHSLASERR